MNAVYKIKYYPYSVKRETIGAAAAGTNRTRLADLPQDQKEHELYTELNRCPWLIPIL